LAEGGAGGFEGFVFFVFGVLDEAELGFDGGGGGGGFGVAEEDAADGGPEAREAARWAADDPQTLARVQDLGERLADAGRNAQREGRAAEAFVLSREAVLKGEKKDAPKSDLPADDPFFTPKKESGEKADPLGTYGTGGGIYGTSFAAGFVSGALLA